MENIDIQWTHLLSVLDRFGNYLCNLLQKKMMNNNSNASGTLVNSFSYTFGIDDDGRYWVDVELEDYWKYVNDGRKPGKMPPVEKIKEWILVKPVKPYPYTYTPSVKSLAFLIQRSIKEKKGYAPPRAVLEAWIEKKGIQPQPRQVYPSVESLAYLIARKIGREGTKGTGFFDEAVDEATKYFEESIDNAIQEDIKVWLEEEMADFLSTFEP